MTGYVTGATSPAGCDVAFLVKNDSGLGHIRRATLLSKQLSLVGISSVTISQASSLALFKDPDLRAVNFPLLERLRSSAADEAYTQLLDAVSARLDPTLVVEDTYPDQRYLSLPSLRHLPRLLVLRRLDPVSFEHLRAAGQFDHYEKVLVAQVRSDFNAEPHAPASRRLVASSGRFTFIGPVFHRPTASEIRAVKARYELDEQPVVVVNAGSGGDQLNDAFADQLFASSTRVASRCRRDGLEVRFILVLGPYYRGRPVRKSENVHVVGFEKHLAALMGAATLVVMRPGHNVVHEALCGDAELVFVPGIPWMEGQWEFAERLATRVGASVVKIGDYGALEGCILDRLVRGSRQRKPVALVDGTQRAAAAIKAQLESATAGPAPRQRKQMLVVLPPPSVRHEVATAMVHTVVSKDVSVLRRRGGGTLPAAPGTVRLLSRALEAPGVGRTPSRDGGGAVYVDMEMPAALTPKRLAEQGVLLALYVDEGDIGMRMRRWTSFSGSERPVIVDAALDRVKADGRRPLHLGWSFAGSLESNASHGVLIDCSELEESQFKDYLVHLREWLDRLAIEPMSQTELIQHRVRRLYGSPGDHGEGSS